MEREDTICVEEMEADVSAPPTTLVGRTLFKGGVLSAFGYRDFSLLWSGAFISNTGTWIHTTALFWLVKELTGSNAWVGVINVANFLPVFFLVLFSGSLADRLNRKRLIIVTQTIMMLGALALAVSVSLNWSSLGIIISLTAIMGIAFVFNFPAWRAIVPDLVPPGEMLNGVALDAAQFNLARFVGPTLGAVILNAWGASAAFYINAVSFLAVIGALLLIGTRTDIRPTRPPSMGEHILEMLRYVRKNRWASSLLVVLAISSIFGLPYTVLFPAMARDVLGWGASGYGLLLGFTGLGAVVGAPLVTLLSRYFKEREIIRFTSFCSALFLLLFSLSRIFWLSLIFVFGMGNSFLMMSSTINAALQSRVKREMRGRIMSMYILVFQGLAPIGGLAMGFVADMRSAPFTLFIGGAVCMGMALVIVFKPSFLRDEVATRTQ